jgi:hypothetical protein
MTKEKSPVTPAVRVLREFNVHFTEHQYREEAYIVIRISYIVLEPFVKEIRHTIYDFFRI